MNANNAALVAGLRDLALFIENNDDFDFTANGKLKPIEGRFASWYLRCPHEEHRAVVSDLARRLGSGKKSYSGEFFHLTRMFGPFVEFAIASERKIVCERVVVGKKTVPAHGEIVIAAAPEQEVDIVEWKCDPILAESPA